MQSQLFFAFPTGGTLGLFTGFSVLSLVEILYWLMELINGFAIKIGYLIRGSSEHA